MGIYYHHLINLIVGSPNSNTFCRAMASPRREFWAEFPGGFVHNPPYTSTTPQLLLDKCWLYYMHSFTTIKNNGFGHWDIAYSEGYLTRQWRTGLLKVTYQYHRWFWLSVGDGYPKVNTDDNSKYHQQVKERRPRKTQETVFKATAEALQKSMHQTGNKHTVAFCDCFATQKWQVCVSYAEVHGPRIVRLSK
jgi:hypothetical protein